MVIGEMRQAYGIFIGNLKGRIHWEVADVHGRIIFNYIDLITKQGADYIQLTQNLVL
jgi:hypothetical protein